MAKRVIHELIDDLDGGMATETVEFSVDGVAYTIDLSDKNAGKLRTALAPFMEHGVRVSKRTTLLPGGRAEARTYRRVRLATEPDPKEVRNWAIKNGVLTRNGTPLSAYGRVGSEIIEAFRNKDTSNSHVIGGVVTAEPEPAPAPKKAAPPPEPVVVPAPRTAAKKATAPKKATAGKS